MRTRTIFEAYKKAARNTLYAKEWRQFDTFERELLRRMDERDQWDALRKMRRPRTFADAGLTTMTIYGKWGI